MHWRNNGEVYYGDGESFVFSMEEGSKERFDAYKWKEGNNEYFVLSNDEALAMGGNGFAFFLDGDLFTGTTGASKTFGNEVNLLGGVGEEDFSVDCVELWSLVPKGKA